MSRSNEPLIWSLFASGGALSALLVPIHIVLLALAIPLGWLEAPAHERLLELVLHPLGKLYLFVLISLPLYTCAHRLLFMLIHLGLNAWRRLITVGCYGGAVAGTVVCAVLLLRL